MNYINLYNNFIKLTTNKSLYKDHDKQDTFNDRLIIFLFHFAFFLKNYKNHENIIPYLWMPKFIDASDASARTLPFYTKNNHY